MQPVPPPSYLPALPEGLARLRGHPWHWLGLALLSSTLASLAPTLTLRLHLDLDPLRQHLLQTFTLMPLNMYFLPRLVARMDAETADQPSNPREGWRERFDQRWLRAFGAQMGLGLATGVGLVLLILPGLLILTFYGWTPTRILLRGEGWTEAMRGSQRAMVRQWPFVVQAALAILLVGLVGSLLLGMGLEAWVRQTDPSATTQLRHPAFWLYHFLSGAVGVWTSAAYLGVFQRLEGYSAASSSEK